MTDQPEALRVADLMAARRVSRWSAQTPHLVGFKPDRECVDAARLLREQHEEIQRLQEAVTKYGRHLNDCVGMLGGYQCTCGFNQQGSKT